jgi:cell division septation protein DedD
MAGRRPSPRDEAARTGRHAEPRRRHGWDNEDAPWLEEAEEMEGPTHTLVGRRTLWGLLLAMAVLVVGVIVGILLVSKRDTAPIDVPEVGEQVPVLAAPGPWKVAPSGRDVDGIPVEGQGQILFGTGVGRDPEARIAVEALPEDPMPRPGTTANETEPDSAAMPATPPPAPAPAVATREAPRAPGPKTIYAPEPEPAARPAAPAQGGGQVLQLGAFSSEARARAAFKTMAERFAYLAGYAPVILPVAKDGATLYRLRTTAPGPAEARDICARLRVAGEACTVVN